MQSNLYRIGIDLGGTKIETILIDPAGSAINRYRIATPRDKDLRAEYKNILEAVHQVIRDTLKKVPDTHTVSIGIGIPGTINDQTGLVQNANTTGLIGQPFQKDLETLLGRSIGMENDANCFTLAESLEGAAKGYNMVFGIILGTGCGGGLSLNGQVHRGRHHIAGEWGHFAVDPQGEICYCGNRGCVETQISGGGVSQAFLKKYGHSLTLEKITSGYRQGDPQCAEAFKQFLENYGRCLGGLISILDPDAVVLGGGVSNIDELYTLGLEKVRQYAFHTCIQTPILKNKLGDSAGVIGAAWIGL